MKTLLRINIIGISALAVSMLMFGTANAGNCDTMPPTTSLASASTPVLGLEATAMGFAIVSAGDVLLHPEIGSKELVKAMWPDSSGKSLEVIVQPGGGSGSMVMPGAEGFVSFPAETVIAAFKTNGNGKTLQKPGNEDNFIPTEFGPKPADPGLFPVSLL